jgi:glycine cleavage system H protein
MVAMLVLLTIVGVLGLDFVVRAWRRRHGIETHPSLRVIPLPEWALLPLEKLRFPSGLFYGRGHTWARLTDEGAMQIGIDDFLNAAIGPVEEVRCVKEGTSVRRGEPLAQLKQGDTLIWARSPVTGTVRRANHGVETAALRTDPYGAGWLAELTPDDTASELPMLRVGSALGEWIRHEALRFGRFLAEPATSFAVATMQDGGLPVERRLAAMGPERAGEFDREFLSFEREA